MHILIVAATPFEILPLTQHLQQRFECPSPGVYTRGELAVHTLVTGIGMVATAWSLGRYLGLAPAPDLALNAGIAGAIDRGLAPGDVVQVVTESIADLGVEEADGRFVDLFELGLLDPLVFPFAKGLLHNPGAEQYNFLPKAKGLSVNRVHGAQASIDALRERYPDAQVESMEGAAFFYACLSANLPFLEIRSISNYVEPRNRETWQVPLAIENLNRVLLEMLGAFTTP